jgi:hypothetical protein
MPTSLFKNATRNAPPQTLRIIAAPVEHGTVLINSYAALIRETCPKPKSDLQFFDTRLISLKNAVILRFGPAKCDTIARKPLDF